MRRTSSATPGGRSSPCPSGRCACGRDRPRPAGRPRRTNATRAGTGRVVDQLVVARHLALLVPPRRRWDPDGGLPRGACPRIAGRGRWRQRWTAEAETPGLKAASSKSSRCGCRLKGPITPWWPGNEGSPAGEDWVIGRWQPTRSARGWTHRTQPPGPSERNERWTPRTASCRSHFHQQQFRNEAAAERARPRQPGPLRIAVSGVSDPEDPRRLAPARWLRLRLGTPGSR